MMNWWDILGNSITTSLLTSAFIGGIAWWGGVLKNRIRDREHLQGMEKLQEQITKLNHTLAEERDERSDLLKRGTLVFQAQFEKEFEIYVSLSCLLGKLYTNVIPLIQARLHIVNGARDKNLSWLPNRSSDPVKPLLEMAGSEHSEKIQIVFDEFSELVESCIAFVNNEIFDKIDEFRNIVDRNIFKKHQSFQNVPTHINMCMPLEIELHKQLNPDWSGDYIEKRELRDSHMTSWDLERLMENLKNERQEALTLIQNRIKELNVIKNN